MNQIGDLLRLVEDTDGILIVNREGVVEYHTQNIHNYYMPQETVGKHILELYPSLTEETSTVLCALRSGRATYNRRQKLINNRGQEVLLDSTTLPIVVDGQVEGVVDSTKFYTIGHWVVRGGRDSGLSSLDRIITCEPAMQELKSRVQSVAQLDCSVLVCGETGTGKELVAESLHSEGCRAGRPFVSQNCAAVPETLAESIFFGTERGSYTGALSKKGLFEIADGGTLFLDEINSMDLSLQAKLLKVLEEKKLRRLGGQADIPFNVRIVAAMGEDPASALREKHLREDLYYRLSVVRISIPPLRERPGDIPLLTRHFIDHYSRKLGRGIRGISPLAERLFLQYGWPGNVRELQNTIEGAIATAQTDTLMIGDVQGVLASSVSGGRARTPAAAPAAGLSLNEALAEYERQLITQTLEGSASISEAARRLGVSRQNLQYRLQKFGLQ